MIGTRAKAVDAVAAVAVLALCGYALQESGRTAWWQWALVCAAATAVAVRRQWPLHAAAIALAASAATLAAGVIPAEASPGLCAAIALTQYPVATSLPPRQSIPALAAALAGTAALALAAPTAATASAIAAAASWTTGYLVRHRRDLAEQVFAERAARAVAEERLRIARDMHDIVAHSLSMIAIKASVARHVATARPDETLTALEVIETASREALTETRRAVGLLRADDTTPAGHDLHDLIRRTEQTGLHVDADLTGESTPPPAVRLVVYRTVQEALANVIRHARATTCTVTVEAGPGSVTVQVTDNGTAPAAPTPTGHGLLGMRERITAYGGDLQAGFGTDGGFTITAHIPYPAHDRTGRP